MQTNLKALVIALLLASASVAQVINTPLIPNVTLQRLRTDEVAVVVQFRSRNVPLNVVDDSFVFQVSEAASGLVRLSLPEGAGIAQQDSATITVLLSNAQVAALTKDSYYYRLYSTRNGTETTRMYGTLWLVKGTLTNAGAMLNTPVVIINYIDGRGFASNSTPGVIAETDPTVSSAAKTITNSNVDSWNAAVNTLPNKVDKVAGKGLSTLDYNLIEQSSVAASAAMRHTHPNKQVLDETTAPYTTQESTKLAGIQPFATSNSTDAQLRNRATHTGAQAISTITNLQDSLSRKVNNTDSRLTDARTPTAHTQAISTINFLQDSLSKKSDTTHRHPISKINGLADELSKKADKNIIDYDDIPTNMFLVNTSNRHVLRIYLSKTQSEYRTTPGSRDMFVNTTPDVLAMPNDWIQFSTESSEVGAYCYYDTIAGPTGWYKETKREYFKNSIWIEEEYRFNQKLIRVKLDSLKVPFSQHIRCSYVRPHPSNYRTTHSLPSSAWPSHNTDEIACQLYRNNLRQPDNNNRLPVNFSTLALLPAARPGPSRAGRQSPRNKYCSTLIS